MARAPSKLSTGQIPAMGEVWPSGREVRLGTADDADAVAQWRTDDAAVNWSLNDAVQALKNGSSETMVYIVDDAQFPIGVLVLGWSRPYLQLVVVDETYRRNDVGTLAASVVIDEFFHSRPDDDWLEVTLPISTGGRRLLERLGFSLSGSGMKLTRETWAEQLPSILQVFDRNRASDDDTTSHQEVDQADDDDDESAPKVAIDAHLLHVVSDEDARARFHALLGKGADWKSELMNYRTTSSWQDDWVIEVGNWLARAELMGYLERVLREVQSLRDVAGGREESDDVHRTVTQRLAQAMAAHYFLGIGWRFGAFEPPKGTERGANGKLVDVDLQLYPPSNTSLVDMQVKASGTLGLADSLVDPQIRKGALKAIGQLPVTTARPALVVMSAQRGWWLSGDTQALETMIGSTIGYDGGRVLLHDDARGELAAAPQVSGIAMLDYRRSVSIFDYSCSVLMNPWATHPLDPEWFPHSRVLSCTDGVFSWIRGTPSASTFPTRTRFAPARVVQRFETAPRSPDAPGLHGLLATIYTKLWHLSDAASPPVYALYELACMMPNGERAYFATGLDDRPFPHTRVARPSCPDGDEPDLAGADIRELISLASVRGYEASWRAGTYEANTMPEVRRAWDHARALLQELGFDDWAAFDDAKHESLAGHRLRGTPEQ